MPMWRSKRFEPPMAFDVVVSNRAFYKIKAAIGYISDTCLNWSYARQLYKSVERSIVELETKESFHIRDQEASTVIGQDIYRIKLGKYKLLYRIDREKHVITVFSFLHESQSFGAVILSDFQNDS